MPVEDRNGKEGGDGTLESAEETIEKILFKKKFSGV